MTAPEPEPQVFRADPGWAFPELPRKAVPAGARVDVSAEETDWTMYDTPDGELASVGGYLARSTAGSWWLGLGSLAPGTPGATRVRTAAVEGRGVPAEFRDLLLGVRAGATLRPERRVRTERVARIVVGPTGELVGEVDEVRRRAIPDRSAADGDTAAEPTESTELPRIVEVIEVEDGFGAAVAKRLIRSGARPVGAPVDPAAVETVGAALRRYLTERRADVLRGDVRLRLGADAVHPTRVAIRRIRSVLRVSSAADPERVAALDAELRWFAGVLGAVRDLDVLRPHLTAALDRLAERVDDAVLLATRRVIDAELDRQSATARAVLHRTMRGRRYLTLLRELRTWAVDPPLDPVAAKRPAKRLAAYAASADRSLTRRIDRAARRDADVEASHRARKAAKRARYVGEFVAQFTAAPSKKDAASQRRRAKDAQRLQDSLGKKQDAAMAAAWLAGLVRSRTATADPAAAFGLGVLWARERRRAE